MNWDLDTYDYDYLSDPAGFLRNLVEQISILRKVNNGSVVHLQVSRVLSLPSSSSSGVVVTSFVVAWRGVAWRGVAWRAAA